MLSDEERRERAREKKRLYAQSEKGKACNARKNKKWNASEGARAATRRYREANPEKVREMRRAWLSTPQGKEHRRKSRQTYKESDSGRTRNREYCRRRYNRNMSREKAAELLALARRAAPAFLPPDLRDDITMDIVTAVMEGRFLVAEIPSAAKAIVSANRKYNSKFGPAPLDAPRFSAGRATLHDSVSAGLWE